MNAASYIPLIVEELKKGSPEKIILFGSFAYGKPNEDSDIDLLVVTPEEIIPGSFKEKSEIYLRFAHLIVDFKKKLPIDLIVHTKAMHNLYNEKNSLFAQEVNLKGKVLFQKGQI